MENLYNFQKKLDNGENLVIDAEFEPKIITKKSRNRRLNPELKYYLRDLIAIYTFGRIFLFVMNENNMYTTKEFTIQTVWMGILTFAQIKCQKNTDGSKNSTFALICITAFMTLVAGMLIFTEV